MEVIQNYINGEYRAPVQGRYLDNFDPSIGKVYGRIPDSTSEDLELALISARAAKEHWGAMVPEQRSKILMAIADGIEKRFEPMAEAESRDNGKPLSLAKHVDIPRAVSNFRFFASALTQVQSESYTTGSEAVHYIVRAPIGIVGCISPWNLPLYLFTWKIAPALAAGNCVIAKPSEVTPFTAYLLGEICTEAGLPAGVLSIIHGRGAEIGSAIVAHPEIKAISFTGGTSTGQAIARQAAPMFKKLSLELGGKNPNIIFDDCDYDRALSTTMRSSFANQGQICLCGSRIFIQEGIYERFVADMVAKAAQLRVGAPLDDNTQIGAIVSKAHLDKIVHYIKLAQEEGGEILAGGQCVTLPEPYQNGYYMRPTIIAGLSSDCRVQQEEIFGPVVTITPFKTEEEVVKMANSTPYGLSSTVWTEQLSRAHRMSQKLEAGIVWINCWLYRDLRTPFGGVKQSGVGREGGMEAMRFFTEAKSVTIKL